MISTIERRYTLDEYRAIDEPFVERYSKQTQGWLLSECKGLEVSISLESVRIELPMAEIYRGVAFE